MALARSLLIPTLAVRGDQRRLGGGDVSVYLHV